MHGPHELFELDEHGIPRRKRVARDREQLHFPYIADHAAYGFSPTFADGSSDFTSPHRKGFRFADTNDAARLAADEAYHSRSRRMETAWQRKGEQQHDQARTKSLDPLRSAADQAYAERSERLQNAWRNRDGA
jgi:hypothetical protein